MQGLGPSGPTHIGPFRSVAVLGQGGMGRVVLAVAPEGRLVAVKEVHAELAEDDGFRARFRREVDASRKVSGAYTAPVIDADPDAQTPWLASQFVPGPSLREALEAAGPLGEGPVRRLAAGLAHALADVHGAGLIHRDLKPSNVLLAEDGVRVIDFGIVRAAGDQTRITHTGALVGSPAFMSPEQITGGEPTPASDVFSLGATLVMACTGNPPFAGDSVPRLLHDVVYAEPDLDAVPPGLRGIIAPCLAKDPAARPTPRELLTMVGAVEPAARPWPEPVYALLAAQQAEVDRLIAGAPAPAPATAPAAVRPRRPRRTRLLVTAGILAVCVAVGLTVGRPFVDEVYYTVVPESVPTPGTTPLSQVDDKYAAKPFTCADVAGKVTVPADFDAPGGYGFKKDENYGWGGPSHLCVWNSRYGDEVYVSWGLYLTEPGGKTGAEQAKEHHEGMYIRGKTRRDFGLGIGEEALWLAPEDDKDAPCVLYLRDVNQTLFVQVKGNRYPVGSCEAVAKDAGRSALAVMARP
ncbi:serine/threonine-protein kinase [Streptomyces sp. NBC_00091]|uniref:serine/threonine-protein kinase n=1 Tax=Streptomyces sp. NBC_00091 TaxID=2975648 RepID=UPI0022534038|nr:serine/threonine-protein kinase [Streptomyces sp. NBC_00091]MCX5378598.1 serine/threonine protein kinase [Streptomyces sp. NBC_00091]